MQIGMVSFVYYSWDHRTIAGKRLGWLMIHSGRVVDGYTGVTHSLFAHLAAMLPALLTTNKNGLETSHVSYWYQKYSCSPSRWG